MNQPNDKLNIISSIKFLGKYLKGHRIQFMAFYIGWFLDSIATIISPIIFGLMMNQIVYYKNVDLFFRLTIVFVTVTLFKCILYYLVNQIYAYNWVMFNLKIKRDVFTSIMNADAQYLSNANTGDLISNVQWYSSESMNFIVYNIIHNINGVLIVIFCTIYLFIINLYIGLLMLVVVPFAVFIALKFGKNIRAYGDEQRKSFGKYISWLFEMLGGIKDIRFLGAERKVNKDFIENHKSMYKVNIRSGLSSMTAQNIISAVNLVIQLIIFVFIAFLSVYAGFTIGSLIVIVTFYSMLTDEVSHLSRSYMDAQNRISYIQRIYDVMHVQSEKDWSGKKELKVTNGDIEFEEIEFGYKDGNRIFNKLSLMINRGEKLALVGKSGCGKTTLAYMLIGFYRPENGEIIIDGQNLKECTLDSIRKNIGLVQQDVLIFDGTIEENLLLGNPRANENEIINACLRAGIMEFIQSLPDGLKTIIGSKGVSLSGGQKQRIAIARIYLKNPSILIFDEATSSLDPETEQQIHEAWGQVLKGRTSIIIAHRQSSVMLCQRVAIIESGKIKKTGNPIELAERDETFRNLFAIKQDGEDND